MKDIKEILSSLSTPDIPDLKHQDRLLKEILSAKNKISVSWWWTATPIYLLLCLAMKNMFYHGNGFVVAVRHFMNNNTWLSLILFLLFPLLCIAVNFSPIRRIYFLSGGRLANARFIKSAIVNIVLVLSSSLVLIIFLMIKLKLI